METLSSPVHSGSPTMSRAAQTAAYVIGAVDLLLETAADSLLIWGRRHRDRRHLAAMDDRLLSDIGLSRGEIEQEISKPFWRA